ncbi:MAG: hypothetical protein EAX96_16325 [Candidatus Lokiarchaeota archaeon]|nr:hypothetical protein [Candidatus Lokiarchaeota archaeon]
MDEKKSKDDKKDVFKFFLLGLDNSGKTSIVLSLTQEINLLSFCNIKPTLGKEVKRHEFHDKLFSFWDFGGQEQYRKNHLEEINGLLKGVDRIIYVIDVQDTPRYDLSLKYLADLLKILEKSEEKFEFSIFFHKYDPNLEKLEPFRDGKLIYNLTDKIKKILPSGFSCAIYKSSIYTVFKKTAHLFI